LVKLPLLPQRTETYQAVGVFIRTDTNKIALDS